MHPVGGRIEDEARHHFVVVAEDRDQRPVGDETGRRDVVSASIRSVNWRVHVRASGPLRRRPRGPTRRPDGSASSDGSASLQRAAPAHQTGQQDCVDEQACSASAMRGISRRGTSNGRERPSRPRTRLRAAASAARTARTLWLASATYRRALAAVARGPRRPAPARCAANVRDSSSRTSRIWPLQYRMARKTGMKTKPHALRR